MDGNLPLSELFAIYKKWVISNPNLVTDVETVATWSSYFVAGKINKSPVVSELVYSMSKLLSLFNDRIIHEAYGNEVYRYGLRQKIRLWLTVIHYTEVFVELIVKERWGTKGKWTVATLIQLVKCSSAFVLLYRFKEIPVAHPPIPALHRKKFTEENDMEDKYDSFFTLRRSGRIVRRVDGAPSVALRDWQPIKMRDEATTPSVEIKDLLIAESLYILKPLIHLASMQAFGTRAWKQWLVALSLDVVSMKLYNHHFNLLTYEQKLEVSRRKLGIVLYLLRSPMYNGCSKNAIETVLKTASNKIPMMSFICDPIMQYLSHWQDLYFYMWSS